MFQFCIKREKIVYTHAKTYIFMLYTYLYNLQTFYFDSIVYKCKFNTNIASKKASKLYNCELYNCSEIQFSLALYNRSVYIVFLFLYKAREKHISSCYTLIIMQYTYILIRFNCMQSKFYKNIAAK